MVILAFTKVKAFEYFRVVIASMSLKTKKTEIKVSQIEGFQVQHNRYV